MNPRTEARFLQLYGIAFYEAQRRMICAKCRQPILAAFDSESFRQYRHIGVCEECAQEEARNYLDGAVLVVCVVAALIAVFML